MDCPTRILVPALSGGGSFSIDTPKRTYLFLWTPPFLDALEPEPEPEDPGDPENVWTIVHMPRAVDSAERPWTAQCHRKVARLTALRCFSEGIVRAWGLNGRYVGYYDKTMAVRAIQRAWRRSQARVRSKAVLAKARVLLELRLLPPRGPLGTLDSFAGGSVYQTLANKY